MAKGTEEEDNVATQSNVEASELASRPQTEELSREENSDPSGEEGEIIPKSQSEGMRGTAQLHNTETANGTSTEPDPPLPKEDPPLPNEEPPLPSEVPPQIADDGWEAFWERKSGRWCFYNHWSKSYTYDNPRVTQDDTQRGNHSAPSGGLTAATASVPASHSEPPNAVAGGYNPAIHGDYDPNADYAKEHAPDANLEQLSPPDAAQIAELQQIGSFNRFTGKWQSANLGPSNHSDEAKSHRQMNAFFDVDAAANSHDGRSLKAERQNQRLTKKEVKAFKEKRRAKKNEKRRGWLLD